MRTISATLALAVAIAVVTLGAQGALGPQGGPTNKNTTPPPGVTPLPVDLFTSKNFYLDEKSWLLLSTDSELLKYLKDSGGR